MTFNSVYQILTPLTTVKKQWFVEWFSGDDLKAYWTKRNINGIGTFAMDDVIGGGFKITTGSTAFNESEIDFNDIRQYSNTSSIIIIVWKFDNSVADIGGGFGDPATISKISSAVNKAFARAATGAGFFGLFTGDGTAHSATNSDVATDANFHSHKVECRSGDVKYTLDGILKITKTTNLPTVKLQPFFAVQTGDATTAIANIRYLEAFNT